LEPNDPRALRLRDEVSKRIEQAKPRILSNFDAFLVTEALLNHAGEEIELEYRSSSAECVALSNQFQEAFKKAGLIVKTGAMADNDVCFDVEIIKSPSGGLGSMATDLFDTLKRRKIAVRISSDGGSWNSITVRIGEKSY
jgi:hypothetical protein